MTREDRPMASERLTAEELGVLESLAPGAFLSSRTTRLLIATARRCAKLEAAMGVIATAVTQPISRDYMSPDRMKEHARTALEES